jgi:hypothetical protein
MAGVVLVLIKIPVIHIFRLNIGGVVSVKACLEMG